jgi:hypothetical protein
MGTAFGWVEPGPIPRQQIAQLRDRKFAAPRPRALRARGPTWSEHNIAANASAPPYPRANTSRDPDVPALTATHCTIVAVDIVGFGDHRRNNSNQVRVRRGLYGALASSFDCAGIPLHRCRTEDRGDGALILVPADVPKALFADRLPSALTDALVAHNQRHPIEEQIRLRLALHAGEIVHDEHGVTSTSINLTFRILDAPALAATFAESSGVLAVIGSAWFYDEVIRHSDWSHVDAYIGVEVTNKETNARAWLRIM